MKTCFVIMQKDGSRVIIIDKKKGEEGLKCQHCKFGGYLQPGILPRDR